ncbi:MAG: RNA polymerase sigma factor (sigma-70 family) [Maribacter sp.]|jgi:RNA polymerase sigma factor (sigma-70 family)
MDECLFKLPEDERSLIWIFYFDELSLKEIIAVIEISETSLKVKLHRARKRLLAIVKENIEPEIISHYGRN